MDFTIFTDASTQWWVSIWGILKFWVPGPGWTAINCLEIQAVISALHHWISVLQGCQVLIATDNTIEFLISTNKEDPFPLLVASSSGSLYVTTSSGHSSQSQAHPRLFERDSRSLISSQPANSDRVESPFRDRDPNL